MRNVPASIAFALAGVGALFGLVLGVALHGLVLTAGQVWLAGMAGALVSFLGLTALAGNREEAELEEARRIIRALLAARRGSVVAKLEATRAARAYLGGADAAHVHTLESPRPAA